MNNLCNWISVPGEFVFDNGFKLPISDPAGADGATVLAAVTNGDAW